MAPGPSRSYACLRVATLVDRTRRSAAGGSQAPLPVPSSSQRQTHSLWLSPPPPRARPRTAVARAAARGFPPLWLPPHAPTPRPDGGEGKRPGLGPPWGESMETLAISHLPLVCMAAVWSLTSSRYAAELAGKKKLSSFEALQWQEQKWTEDQFSGTGLSVLLHWSTE